MSDDELARLQRWVDSGALVRIIARRGDRLSLALVTCDGGTEMGRVISDDPVIGRWAAEHAEDLC